jgi:hypothetical protein
MLVNASTLYLRTTYRATLEDIGPPDFFPLSVSASAGPLVNALDLGSRLVVLGGGGGEIAP